MASETDIALDFARAMDAGEITRAHDMLSSSLRSSLTAEQLGADFAAMVPEGEGRASLIQVMTTMDNWPDKRPGDLLWVYVAMGYEMYSEAVTVVVAEEQSRPVIRSIEWGRP